MSKKFTLEASTNTTESGWQKSKHTAGTIAQLVDVMPSVQWCGKPGMFRVVAEHQNGAVIGYYDGKTGKRIYTQPAYFNRFTLEVPEKAVEDCSRPGQDASEAVAYWLDKVDFSHVVNEDIRRELLDSGGWEREELEDNDENKKKILWMAACNIVEELKNP